MSHPEPRHPLAVRIDRACNRFEEAWRSGPPRIEDFLEGFHGEERVALLCELVAIDLEYRRRRGEEAGPEDYSIRLPDLADMGQQTAAISADTSCLQTGLPAGRVGDYEILAELESGGMGVVYRAIDHSLGREVAVKALREGYARDSGTARRFLKEARITAQLQHPAIPPVHQVGELPDGRPFLAMKLIKGRTLEVELRATHRETVDLGQRLAAFEQICQAVAYAHSRGVIHRDLKPANIMVGAFGEVQVMDWGLAKILPDASAPPSAPPDPGGPAQTVITPPPDSDGANTQAGTMIGTPAFMPPEQAGGESDKVDRRADVFGLGAILAVILTGQPPYVGQNAETVRLMAIRGQTAACLARLDGCEAEPALVALCKRCLAFEPDDRFRDAGAVAQEVAHLRAATEERVRLAELDAAAKARTSAALEEERDRVLLALTAQAAERLESDLKQVEQVGQALAVLGQEADLHARHLEAWMQGMVQRDARIFGLTLAFEPGHGFDITPEDPEFCLYVSRRDGPITKEHLHLQQYRYRGMNWYTEPVRTGQQRWSATPGFDPGAARALCVAFVVPVRRQGEVVGVAAVDLVLDEFFGTTGALRDWHAPPLSEQRRGYWFVVSHTVTPWDAGSEIRWEQPGRERGWAGEAGTGAFVSHPNYRFPQRIKDLPALPTDFSALADRLLRRDEAGRLAEPSGIAKATDPASGKPSRFLFTRIPSAEWTFVMVIEEAGATP